MRFLVPRQPRQLFRPGGHSREGSRRSLARGPDQPSRSGGVGAEREGYQPEQLSSYGATTENVPKGVLMLAPLASPDVRSWLKK